LWEIAMPEFLGYGFMLRALLASLLVGLVCSIVGTFVVLRGLSFIGAGIAHAAFAGVTLGFLVGLSPIGLAIVFSLVTVWLIGVVSRRGELSMDVSVGIFFALTMALAILFIGLMPSYNAEVYGYLFGNILAVTRGDLILISVVTAAVLVAVFLFFKEFQYMMFDQEMAEASGIPAAKLFYLLLTLIAVTIVVSLRAVGVILVFALIVTPASSAYQFTHSLKKMIALSAAFGVFASFVGLLLSYRFDLPSGSTMVMVAGLIFFISALLSPKRKVCRIAHQDATDRERTCKIGED